MLLGKRGNRSLSSLKFIKELIKFIRKFLHDDARNRARQFHTASCNVNGNRCTSRSNNIGAKSFEILRDDQDNSYRS